MPEKPDLKNINVFLANVQKRLNHGEYQDALESVLSLDPHVGSNPRLDLTFGGVYIDLGKALDREDLLDKGVALTKGSIEKFPADGRERFSAAYNLANGIEAKIRYARRSESYWIDVGDDAVEEAKSYYREAVFHGPDPAWVTPEFCVNYANFLRTHCGRDLEALEWYEEALKRRPGFPMALANKATSLAHLADAMEGEVRKVLIVEAYVLLQEALSSGLEAGPRARFEKVRNRLAEAFTPEPPKERLVCKDLLLKPNRGFQYFYRNFCHEKRLYLNPFDLSHRCRAALRDPLMIRTMTTAVDDNETYYRFCSYVNNIKQEFVTARYLAAQSAFKDPKLRFVDRGVHLIDTLDHAAHNIHTELAKTAFRLAYSALDKVAFVANEYMQLGFSPDRLHFHHLSTVGNDEQRGRVRDFGNPYISALCDLANDFRPGEFFGAIRNIRNAFEHRFQTIHQDFATPRILGGEEYTHDSSADMLKVGAFREHLAGMLRLAKSAIVYLAMMIDYAEWEKTASSTEPAILMPGFSVPDDLKGEF